MGVPDVFQSTLPHGERLQAAEDAAAELEFQSTLPHGERHGVEGIQAALNGVSIHAPARGATSLGFSYIPRLSGFNPRSRTGSDRKITDKYDYSDKFQSTLPHGERHQCTSNTLCAL